MGLAFWGEQRDEWSGAKTARKETDMTKIESFDPPAPAGSETTRSTPEAAAGKRGMPTKKGQCKARPKAGRREGMRQKRRRQYEQPSTMVAGAEAQKSTAKPDASRNNGPDANSTGAHIVQLISRPKGATLAEIMKTTGWQAHSVRGFVSTAGKKYGYQVESLKNAAGERVYEVKK